MKYTKENPLRVFTAFSGYDSQILAIERLKKQFPDFDYTLVGWSEIDKYAIIAHDALFPDDKDKNFGDICKIDWAKVPDFDLFTYSWPCTDISVAGRQEGFAKGSGTRSSLLWECERAIQIKRPKYLLMENVKALVHEKNRKLFKEWLFFLDKLGYENFLPPEFPTPWKGRGAHTALYTINAADMGVPQNHERVFLVSILRTEEDPNPKYYFPEPFPLEKKLKDVLEEHVDEKYYLSDKMLEYFQSVNDDDSHGHDFNPKTEDDDTAFTIRTKPGQRVDDNFFME